MIDGLGRNIELVKFADAQLFDNRKNDCLVEKTNH